MLTALPANSKMLDRNYSNRITPSPNIIFYTLFLCQSILSYMNNIIILRLGCCIAYLVNGHLHSIKSKGACAQGNTNRKYMCCQ